MSAESLLERYGGSLTGGQEALLSKAVALIERTQPETKRAKTTTTIDVTSASSSPSSEGSPHSFSSSQEEDLDTLLAQESAIKAKIKVARAAQQLKNEFLSYFFTADCRRL
jgi:hypothetical protein